MTVGNASSPVASMSAGYGQWLAHIMLQRKSMQGQEHNVAELLKAMPSPESHLGKNIDVRL